MNEATEGAVSGAVNNAGGYWFNAENGYKPTVSGALRSAGTGFGIGMLTPGVAGGTAQQLGFAKGFSKVVSDRVTDGLAGGTNYLISPSNDNEAKTPRKFAEEGFRNALTGGATSSGKWSEQTSSAAIRQAVPDHLQGVEVSRRDFITGDLPAPPSVSSGDGQGYDQRRQ